MVYLVLGMHKSGTTLVAETLFNSGVNMGFDLNEQDIDYSKEKSEGRLLREINNDILDSHGKSSLDIFKLPRHGTLNNDIVEKIKILLKAQEGYVDWGMKDPRLVLTYEIWKKFLPDHKLIIVFRNPLDVVFHYIRGLRLDRKIRNGVSRVFNALRIYETYNSRLLDIISENEKNVFIANYEALMNGNEVMDGLKLFLNRELIDCRTTSHNKTTEKGDQIFRWLIKINAKKSRYIFEELMSAKERIGGE